MQDSILFTYDDLFVVPEKLRAAISAPSEKGIGRMASTIRKGTHFEYEMYNLQKDPGELTNLLYGKISPEFMAEAKRLHAKLKEKMDKANAVRKRFVWPASPVYSK